MSDQSHDPPISGFDACDDDFLIDVWFDREVDDSESNYTLDLAREAERERWNRLTDREREAEIRTAIRKA